MKDYIKKGNYMKKYAAAEKSEAEIKGGISKILFMVQEVKTSIFLFKTNIQSGY